MESSPLKFMDNDVSQMLCEQVRLSKEEESRKFHDDLYYNGEKMNEVSHNFIVKIYLDGFFGIHQEYVTSRVFRRFPLTDPQWPYILGLCLKNHERELKGLWPTVALPGRCAEGDSFWFERFSRRWESIIESHAGWSLGEISCIRPEVHDMRGSFHDGRQF